MIKLSDLSDLSEDLKTNISIAGLGVKTSYNIMEVKRITGISRGTIYRMIDAGVFETKPSMLTRRVTLLSLDKYYKNDN